MTKGEHYYIEAYHTDNNQAEHLEISVEIEAVFPPVAEEGEEQQESEFFEGHHHAVAEIQTFGIEAEQIFERTRVTVTDLDDGVYILIIQNKQDLSLHSSKPMNPKMTAEEFYYGVRDYYANHGSIKSDISVTLEQYDANDELTDGGVNSTEPVKNVYTIELKRLVWHQTALDITVMKATSSANVEIELPDVVQNSS